MIKLILILFTTSFMLQNKFNLLLPKHKCNLRKAIMDKVFYLMNHLKPKIAKFQN